MNGKTLTFALVYIALTGTIGQENFDRRKDLGVTSTPIYRSINVTRLFKCFCHYIAAAACNWPTTTSDDKVTNSTMPTTDMTGIEPLFDCYNINDLLNCLNDQSYNDICSIHCYSALDDNTSVIITLNNNQIVSFVLQNFTEETQSACNNVPLTTFTPPAQRLENGTTTIIPLSSDAVNRTVDYELDKLSPGSIAGIAVGVTLAVVALVCIVVGYLLCKRRYLRPAKKIPRPPAKSYLHNDSFKKVDNSCQNGNISSVNAKDAEKNSSTAGVYNNQAFRPDNTLAVVDTSDGGDGLVYEDISGLKPIHDNPDFLQRISSEAKSKYIRSEMNNTYSNLPENYVARDSCLTYDLSQVYVELSSESSVKLPIPNDFISNQTVPPKSNLNLYVNNADPIAISTVNVFDESLSPNGDYKKESVYFELEKVSDDEDEIAEIENDTEIYSNV